MSYPTFREIAERVASRLMDDLKSGTIAKIDIYTIRAALRREPVLPLDPVAFDKLEEMTTRRVVMKVG